MNHRARPLPIRLLRWSSVLSLALLAACSSPGPRRGGMPEQRLPPQAPLAGETAFFANTLVASARVSATQRPRPAGGDPADDDGSRGGRPGGGGGFGGGPMDGGGMGMGPGGGGRMPGGSGMRGGMGGGLPRQSLVVSFLNSGPEPVDITVVEVKSLMGNFVPVPETFTLAPGQVQALESMRSSLANLEELAVSVTLRRGDTRETQVIILRPGQ